jgi:hypothetical protein
LAPYSPGATADGVVYVSGTLSFDKDNNVLMSAQGMSAAAGQPEWIWTWSGELFGYRAGDDL